MRFSIDTALEFGERFDGEAKFAHYFKCNFHIFRTGRLVDGKALRVAFQIGQYLHNFRGIEVHADQAGLFTGAPVECGAIFVGYYV